VRVELDLMPPGAAAGWTMMSPAPEERFGQRPNRPSGGWRAHV
jgi:hypothetical protein